MLLIASFRELLLHMIDDYPNMTMSTGKILFSESSVRKFTPKHIKPATERHRGMCGCTVCTIYKAMYKNIHLWQLKQIRQMQNEIDKIERPTRSKLVMELALKRYKRTVMKDDQQYPERAWDFASMLACEKVEIKKDGNENGCLCDGWV